jgi:DNA repair ATPase RecN
MIVKGVDHFVGFFPFEGRSLGDWNKRGKRDALRDLRLLDKSDLGKSGAELEMLIESITKMVKANPWLGKSGTEMISTMRSMEGRMKSGFPTVDAIATLQSLKSYVPGSENVTIEFPEKELLEDIAEGIKDLANLEEKIDTVENRMFEIEKVANSPEYASRVTELADRADRLEKQLEKVSNILTMLNSKVESYFSKSAEKERQADLERRIEEHTSKALSHESKIGELEKEAEALVQEMRKMTTKMDKDLQDSRKRIARMEKHFVDLAKMIQE